ncbi:hypothetical protein C1H46_003957 [Malus baccata]|uniref:Uncharacterized protein n=1 Tax=Malus baccata TaxID=106549 RepID=A0A540NHI1_MALBA|nr:hypothetical protein C1H46_003957 [Malus baccata]
MTEIYFLRIWSGRAPNAIHVFRLNSASLMIRETGDNGGTIPETTVAMDENMESLIIGEVATVTERQEEKEPATEE